MHISWRDINLVSQEGLVKESFLIGIYYLLLTLEILPLLSCYKEKLQMKITNSTIRSQYNWVEDEEPSTGRKITKENIYAAKDLKMLN